MEIVTTIIAIITALGGLKLIEFTYDKVTSRKKHKSGIEKDVYSDRMDIINQQFEFLAKQIALMKVEITERDVKIDALQTKVDILMNDKIDKMPAICYNLDCNSRNRTNNKI